MRNDLFKNRVACQDFIVYNDKIYFSCLNCNALYKCDLNGDNLRFISFFPNEKIDIRNLHGALAELNGKIFFAPLMGKCVAIYNIETNEMVSVDISNIVGDCSSKYFDVCINRNKVYMIPARSEYILEIDSVTDKITFHNEWMKNINFYDIISTPAIRNGTFILNDKMYIPFSRKNILIEIELDSFSEKIIPIGDDNVGFVDAIYDKYKNEVYLLKNGQCQIVRYSFNNCEINIIQFDSNSKYKNPYINMIKIEKNIFIIPYNENYFFKINIDTDEVKKFNYTDFDRENNEWEACYYTAKKIGGEEFLAIKAGDYYWELYDKNCTLKSRYYLKDDNMIIRTMMAIKELIRENDVITLNDFIQNLIKK